MRNISYIAAVALFAAVLLIVSAPGSIAAAPSEGENPVVGAPQGPGAMSPTQSGGAAQTPQGVAPGTMQTGPGMAAQQGFSAPGQQQPSGFAQPMTGQRAASPPPGSPGAGPAPVAEAVVIGVDTPENCLKIRRGPSTSYEQIGCAKLGDKLRLTGVFSSDNRWAQLDDNGWVFTCQIKTDFRPPGPAVSCTSGPSYEYGRTWRVPATSGYETWYYYRPYWRHHRFWHPGHHFYGHLGHPGHPGKKH